MVFRSVNPDYVKSDMAGGPLLSSQAFNDPNMQPSVDWAHMVVNPTSSLRGDNHGVVRVSVAEIRAIGEVRKGPEDNPEITYTVDVQSNPVEGNNAHALIICSPDVKSRGVFDRLKEALARIASGKGWVIAPTYSATIQPPAGPSQSHSSPSQ